MRYFLKDFCNSWQSRSAEYPPDVLRRTRAIARTLTLVLIAALALCSLTCAAQSPADFPGKIVLLSGYQHEARLGNDSRIGRIWKDKGLSISYDIGGLAPDRISGSNLQWSKEQIVDDSRVQIGLTKNRLLIVVFAGLRRGGRSVPNASFEATVRSDEDIADMMFMVMTYTPN